MNPLTELNKRLLLDLNELIDWCAADASHMRTAWSEGKEYEAAYTQGRSDALRQIAAGLQLIINRFAKSLNLETRHARP